MFKTLANVFKVPELRNKILFTLFLLAIYRIGFSVTLPGVDQTRAIAQLQQQQSGETGVAGRLASYVSIFSGGNINQSTIFGLGLMPYISASIIFQLGGTVIPALEKMQKEGESGQAQNPGVDALCDRNPWDHSRLVLAQLSSKSGLDRALFRWSWTHGFLGDGIDHPRDGHTLPDVARRAD